MAFCVIESDSRFC